MGLSFGIALSLVLMAGAELFTGTNMIMMAGALNKNVSFGEMFKVWIVSYLGNLLGAILVGILFVYSGSSTGNISEFIIDLSKMKIALSPMNIFFKGILCNILVCLAVLCSLKLKDETAKLMMIFWCLFAFITSGYEHSIANISLFTAGFLLSSEVSLAGISYNLFW